MVVAADLVGVGMDVDQPLPRRRNLEQRIALRRRLRHPAADQQHQIRRFDPRFELGIDGEADLAGEIVVLAVEGAGAAKRAHDRQVEALGEPGEGGARPLGPSAPAEDGDRPIRRPQHLLQFGHLRQARPDRGRLDPGRVGHGGHFRQHVFGQRDHHRAGPALHRRVERALDDLGNLRGSLDLRRQFGGRGEESAIIHLLERAPPHHRPLDLADEQDHRRRIVLGDMHAMRGVGRAGAAGDEADPRPSGEPPLGQRHHRRARFLPAHGDFDRRVVHGVERGEEGFAWNAVDAFDPLDDELVDENLSARSQSLAQPTLLAPPRLPHVSQVRRRFTIAGGGRGRLAPEPSSGHA